MATKKQIGIITALTIIAILGLVGISIHLGVSVYRAYGETATNQQLMASGLLATPHLNNTTSTTTATTTIPASPFTSHGIS